MGYERYSEISPYITRYISVWRTSSPRYSGVWGPGYGGYVRYSEIWSDMVRYEPDIASIPSRLGLANDNRYIAGVELRQRGRWASPATEGPSPAWAPGDRLWRSGGLAAGEDPEGRIEAQTASSSFRLSCTEWSHSMRPQSLPNPGVGDW